MGLLVVKIPGLSTGPRVWVDGDKLVARTGWLGRLVRLFAASRAVIADPRSKVVLIDDRTWWVRRDLRAVRFSDVAYVEYRLSTLVTSATVDGRVSDVFESFTVSLVLRTDEEVPLFAFRGGGSAGDLGTVLLGDGLVDVEGGQDGLSRAYAWRLKELLGVPLGRPLRDA